MPQPKLKVVLDKLKDQNIIADVDKPTEWVSNLVVVQLLLLLSTCEIVMRLYHLWLQQTLLGWQFGSKQSLLISI